MRTTLTLDADVAAVLERIIRKRGTGLKRTINDALRRGLAEMEAPAAESSPYTTPSESLGRCFLPNLDNIGDVLAVAENEAYR